MKYHSDISQLIIDKAKSLGASLAGVAKVSLLKESPSSLVAPKIAQYSGVGTRDALNGLRPGEIAWPPNAKSAIIIAVEHPESRPEMDWWFGTKNPPGNLILIRINKELSQWIEDTLHIKTHKLPYHVEKGGIYLKDAAALAGLGCIGRNNLLITPDFGPRVRLRGMLLEEDIEPTGPIKFDPCEGCAEFCRLACPQSAFSQTVFSEKEMGTDHLPGRDGTFSRVICNVQMEKDIADAREERPYPESGELVKIIKYCRRCELACPVGR